MARFEFDVDGRYMFWCPGCQEVHYFTKDWQMSGDPECPTFFPSLRYLPHWRMPPGWNPDNAPRDANGKLTIRADGKLVDAVEWTCHLFVKNGQIEYLSDCTHELRGTTIPLPDLPKWIESPSTRSRASAEEKKA